MTFVSKVQCLLNRTQGLVVKLVDATLHSPVLGFSLSHNTLNALKRETPTLKEVQNCVTYCKETENWTRVADASNMVIKIIHCLLWTYLLHFFLCSFEL